MNIVWAKSNKTRGFTIVELLIIIVVIAILAAIIIVAYSGIQQRATNTAIVSGVSSTARLVAAYNAAEGSYPRPGDSNGNWCLTQDNDCRFYNGTQMTSDNSLLMTDLKKYGNPLQALTHASSDRYGIYYTSSSTFMLNGILNPAMIVFWLRGTNQDCTVISGMVSVRDAGSGNYVPAVSSNSNSNGQTRCYAMFPN